MSGHQVLEGAVGTGAKLGHHLAGAKRAKAAAGGDVLALGVGMQKTCGVEIAGTGGIHQGAEFEGLNGMAAHAVQDQ